MSAITGGFPPGEDAFERYHETNLTENRRWFEDLQSGIQTARPDAQIAIIPVASVLAQLFATGGALSDIPASALYSDAEPHGRPTLYMLAAMVTYSALYDAPPPADFRPPATLHPDLVSRYSDVAQTIWQAMPDAPQPAAAPASTQPAAEAVAPVPPPLPQRKAVVLPPSGIRPDGIPALGMGLNGIADWSTQHPFVDLMKTARDWVGHLPGQWGGISSAELRAEGHLSPDGWPLRIPEAAERLEAVLLTDQPEDATYLAGTYLVFYDGKGDLELTGRARRARTDGEGRMRFSYTPGEGVVGLSLSSVDPDDPIRNIRVIREDQLDLHEAGVLFNPLWIDRVRDLRSVRFMDWMLTNGSPIQSWKDRPQLSDATWTAWGVPAEVMLALANQIGADPWFTMPHMADDEYVRKFAELVRDRLDPRLHAYVEYSNEVWNQIFPQAVWARAQSEALWGPSDTGWMQFYGLRAAQVMDIWSEAFGDEADSRLIRVMATHTGWFGLEEEILMAPLAFLQLGRAPADSFDAYAVTGYFGYEMGGPEMARQMGLWLDQAEAEASAKGEARGLRRVALREYVKGARFDAAIAPVAAALAEGSLRQLTDEVFPYHAAAANRADLDLVMYEGGTHVAGHGAQVNDERLTAFFTAFNYTPEMAKLYEQLLAGWTQAGGTLFNAFVDVAPATQWGSWGALRHLEDANPRWDMLMAFNASGPNGWESRDVSAFGEGLLLRARSGGDVLDGSARPDILLGGPGGDTLVSKGGTDHLHGGGGQDRAVLPGSRTDYTFTRRGGALIGDGPSGPVTFFSVEILEFEDTAGQEFRADQL